MVFWEGVIVWQVLLVAMLLWLGDLVGRSVPGLSRLAIPSALIGGCMGLAMGPDVLGLLPLDRATLESGVYHGLGVLFITVGLGALDGRAVGRGFRSWSRAVPLVGGVQMLVGSVMVGLTALLATAPHPGWGLLLPLGFMQGPGQALVLGKSWEASGMVSGAQAGLVFAAAGFVWSLLLGVPLVMWGQRRGLWGKKVATEGGPQQTQRADDAQPEAISPLSRAMGWVAALYALTHATITGLIAVLPNGESMAPSLWGFHFLVGMSWALAVSRLSRGASWAPEAAEIRKLSGVTVDFMTCAALAAVAPGVLRANLLFVLATTAVGAVVTLLVCVWLASRAFEEERFEHAVLLFGTMTGTLPTGMALLRMVDPQLTGSAPRRGVGSGGALALAAPGLIAVGPVFASRWPDPVVLLYSSGVVSVYLALLMAWWTGGDLAPPHRWTLWAETP